MWNKIVANKSKYFLSVILLIVPFVHTYTLWFYSGEKVDESEIVHYAIGFFGGDLNPHWLGYGGFVMYIMYLFYWLLGLLGILVGHFDNLTEYLLQIFTNGYFFQSGRYLVSVAGMLALLVYYQLTRRLKIPIAFSLVLLLSYIGAQDAIVYSNYIRTDQFVGLYMALAIYFLSDSSEGRRKYFITSFFIAAAITSKISAVALVLVLYVDMIFSFYKGRIRFQDILSITLFFFAALLILSPYQNVFVHLFKVASSTLLDYKVPIGREQYSSVLDRLEFIYVISKNNIGYFFLYALYFVPFAFVYKRTLVIVIGFIFAFILPYLFSSELREYWFLPFFNLLRFLSLLSMSGLIVFIVNNYNFRYPYYVRKVTCNVVVVLFVVFVALPNMKGLIGIYQNNTGKSTNKELARIWLEKNLVGDAHINFDRHWGSLMPKVYGVNIENLRSSKDLSRMFIYNRQNNMYLNDLFEHYLYNRYLFDVYVNQNTVPNKLKRVRIDPSTKKRKGISVRDLSICQSEKGCIDIDSNIKFVNASAHKGEDNAYVLDASNNDSRIIINFVEDLKMDGSYVLNFETNHDEDYVEVFFDYGEGFSSKVKYVTSKSGVVSVRLVSFANASISKIGMVNLNDPLVYKKIKGSYFVTSPDIYTRFKNNSKNGELASILDYYQAMTSNKLIKRFAEERGHIIEIYKID